MYLFARSGESWLNYFEVYSRVSGLLIILELVSLDRSHDSWRNFKTLAVSDIRAILFLQRLFCSALTSTISINKHLLQTSAPPSLNISTAQPPPVFCSSSNSAAALEVSPELFERWYKAIVQYWLEKTDLKPIRLRVRNLSDVFKTCFSNHNNASKCIMKVWSQALGCKYYFRCVLKDRRERLGIIEMEPDT